MDDFLTTLACAGSARDGGNVGVDVRQSLGSQPQKACARFQNLADRLFLVGNCADHQVRPRGDDLICIRDPGIGQNRARGTRHFRDDVSAILRARHHAVQFANRREDDRRAGLQAYDAPGSMSRGQNRGHDPELGGICFSAAANASTANCAAWLDACGKPPTAAAISSRRRACASRTVLPVTISVNADPQAMAATHPLALKRASTIRPSLTFIVSRRMSPQAGFSISAAASASGMSPAFLGFWKWSRSCAEYMLLDCKSEPSRRDYSRGRVPSGKYTVQPRWRAAASRSGLGFTAKPCLAMASISASQRELPNAASTFFLRLPAAPRVCPDPMGYESGDR